MDTSLMVIDTGVFIEYLRAKNKGKTKLSQLSTESTIFVSAVTIYELHMGATSEAKKGHLTTLLEGIPVLSFDKSVAELSAEIFRSLKSENQLIEFRDIFIGATALVHGYPVLTLNEKHFSRIPGLELV